VTLGPAQEGLDSGKGSRWSRVPWIRLLAEFAVIFLGVTLSLLADDWRQSRTELEIERQALQGLLVDLETESVALDSLRSQVMLHDHAAMWLYQRLGDSGVDADSVTDQLGATHGFDILNVQRASYTGLLSTGQLGVIRDEALRRRIISYYEDLHPEVLGFYDIYFRDAWYPFRELAGYDYQWVYDEDAERFEGRSSSRLLRDWSDISSDPAFVYRLREVGVVAGVLSRLAFGALAQNDSLRVAIRGHLDR